MKLDANLSSGKNALAWPDEIPICGGGETSDRKVCSRPGRQESVESC